MVVPFGFSTGDFVAVISLVIKICQAFDDCSDVSKVFKCVKAELQDFEDVVQQSKRSILTGTAISEENAKRAKQILDSSEDALKDFHSFIASFKGMGSVHRRLTWALRGKDKVRPFRQRIQHYMTILGLVQQELNRQAVQDLRDQFQERTEALSLQVQQESMKIKLHFNTSKESPWDQRPIEFQDAIGRRYPVPLEMCREIDRFINFLELAFKDFPKICAAITRGKIWLFTPSGKCANLWYLIRGRDWAHLVHPGMRLGMSVFPTTRDPILQACTCARFSKLSGKISGAGDMVRFEKPLPPWAPYSENLQFEYVDEGEDPMYNGTISSVSSEYYDDAFPIHNSIQTVNSEASGIQPMKQSRPSQKSAHKTG